MTAQIIPFPSRAEFDYGYDAAILCDRLEGYILHLMEGNDWSDDSAKIRKVQAELHRLLENDQPAECTRVTGTTSTAGTAMILNADRGGARHEFLQRNYPG
jgi:hypothetical protein